MRQSSRLIYNAIVVWVMRLLCVFPEVLLLPFLVRTIGESRYGVYAMAWSLFLALETLQLGLSSGVIKYGAAHLAQNHIAGANTVLSTALVCSVISGFVGCISIVLLAIGSKNQMEGLAFTLVMVALMVLVVFPTIPYVGIVLSKQRYDLNAVAETAGGYIRILLVMGWFGLFGPSLKALVVLSVTSRALGRLVLVPAAYYIVPGLRMRVNCFEWHTCRTLASFGGMIILCSVCLMLNQTGMRWMMGWLVSPAFVAHLAIMLAPGLLLAQMIQAMTLAVMPAATTYATLEKQDKLRELLVRGVRYSLVFAVSGSLVAIMTMDRALRAWVGPEYEFLGPYATWAFCSTAFAMSTSCAHHMLRGIGHLKVSLLNSVVGVVVVPGVVILIVLYGSGQAYWAVAAGVVLGNVVYGIMQLAFCGRAMGVSWKEFMSRAYGPSFVVGVPVGTAVFGLAGWTDAKSLLAQVTLAAFGVFLFVVGFFLLFSSPAERAWVAVGYHLTPGRVSSGRQELSPCKRVSS